MKDAVVVSAGTKRKNLKTVEASCFSANKSHLVACSNYMILAEVRKPRTAGRGAQQGRRQAAPSRGFQTVQRRAAPWHARGETKHGDEQEERRSASPETRVQLLRGGVSLRV